jgi:importin subunit beta-1
MRPQGERNFIMQVVCEATQSSDERIQLAAFECLVRIMQLYYDKMRFYMEKALFGVSIHSNVSSRLFGMRVELYRTDVFKSLIFFFPHM